MKFSAKQCQSLFQLFSGEIIWRDVATVTMGGGNHQFLQGK
jgi:hypothetical protein